jgi:hypothetical protein
VLSLTPLTTKTVDFNVEYLCEYEAIPMQKGFKPCIRGPAEHKHIFSARFSTSLVGSVSDAEPHLVINFGTGFGKKVRILLDPNPQQLPKEE